MCWSSVLDGCKDSQYRRARGDESRCRSVTFTNSGCGFVAPVRRPNSGDRDEQHLFAHWLRNRRTHLVVAPQARVCRRPAGPRHGVGRRRHLVVAPEAGHRRYDRLIRRSWRGWHVVTRLAAKFARPRRSVGLRVMDRQRCWLLWRSTARTPRGDGRICLAAGGR